jgi:hypothetical protein
MTCIPCQKTRQQFVDSLRARDARAAMEAARRAALIAVDKMRGIDVNTKYGGVPPVRSSYRGLPDWKRK